MLETKGHFQQWIKMVVAFIFIYEAFGSPDLSEFPIAYVTYILCT